jgi:hypothetical protein
MWQTKSRQSNIEKGKEEEMGGEKGRKRLWPERDRQTACVLIMAIL